MLWKNPTAFNLSIAGALRYSEMYAVIYFLPAFFQKVYPHFKTEYGLYNALILGCLGFLSNIVSGLISDRFEKKSRMTKAWVSAIGSLLAIIPVTIALLTTNNFYVSLGFMALKYLFSEGWMSPTVTMIQSTVSSKDSSSLITAFLFVLTLISTMSTIILGHVANLLGAASNPAIYG
jgi:MFS family permease